MSANRDPVHVLRTVPGIDASEFHIEVLGGGLTNRVYKLASRHETFVMRLDAEHTAAFGLSRSTEYRVLQEAGKRGFAPEIIHSNIDDGIVLLRYVEGRVWTPEDLIENANLEALGDLLRAVHALPLSRKRFDAMAIARRYQENLEQQPALREFGNRCIATIEGVDDPVEVTCCHNDVVAANIIAGPRLMLLDWEYACDNDPLFDLASIIAYHSLDQYAATILLAAYSGNASPELREKLSLQIRLFRAIYGLWLAARHVTSPSPGQAKTLGKLSDQLN